MRFLWGKLVHLSLVVVAVTALTFLMLDHVPADIASEVAGQGATSEDIAAVRERLGLNDPLPVRYGRWIAAAVRGDLGNSFASGQPVVEAIRSHLPVTVELIVLAQLFALLLAIPAGVVTAWRAGSPLDRTLGTVAFGFASLPAFALAIGLILVFALRLKWLPATGYTPLTGGIAANLKGFLLPALSIALVEWVPLMRVLRGDMISTLKEDFILLARCKGLPTRQILIGHALRPSCFTLVTVFGMQAASLIGGAVLIELIFSLPGIGRLLVTGIFAQDYPVVQGCVLLIAMAYVGMNFLVDVCYGLLDPRVLKGGR
ncbi:MAG: ABC transporter permease [Geobacter sp.]|nr:ABC transporter permease [Geobacter sp.]